MTRTIQSWRYRARTDSPKGWQEARVAHLLGEYPRGELGSMVGMNNAARTQSAGWDGNIENVHHKGGVLFQVNRPAVNLSTARVRNGRSEDFSFSRGMFWDVGDPEIIDP